jgi:pimeloyl-ACP methyl ester carboxylesterase
VKEREGIPMDNLESPTVVLVHGAGGGAWVWEPLAKELNARGIQPVEVDLPTSDQSREPTLTFHDDADCVRSVLDHVDGPVVLVGNSYGGVVITEASADHPNVARLVYLAAFMPDGDEEAMTFCMANTTPEFFAGVTLTSDGRGGLDSKVAAKIGFQQSTPDLAEWAVSKLQPMAMGRGGSPTLLGVGWRNVPSTYVVCGEDRCIRPEAQREWAAERATESIELPYDHCPMVSHPAEIADLLARIVTDRPA